MTRLCEVEDNQVTRSQQSYLSYFLPGSKSGSRRGTGVCGSPLKAGSGPGVAKVFSPKTDLVAWGCV